MAKLTKLEKNISYVSSLSDYPNSNDGMSSSQLKETFDKSSNDIKDFINNTLTEEIDLKAEEDANTYATKEELRDLQLGQLIDGTVTIEKLSIDVQNKVNKVDVIQNDLQKTTENLNNSLDVAASTLEKGLEYGLSYQTPTVRKAINGGEEISLSKSNIFGNLSSSSISQTMTGTATGNLDARQIKFKCYSSVPLTGGDPTTSAVSIQARYDGTVYPNNVSYLNQLLATTSSYSNKSYIDIRSDVPVESYMYFEWDLIKPCSATFNTYGWGGEWTNATYDLLVSNDYEHWNTINSYDFVGDTARTNAVTGKYRYYRVKINIENGEYVLIGGNVFRLYYCYLSNVDDEFTYVEDNTNVFTVEEDLSNITNNRRVLIETKPSFYENKGNTTLSSDFKCSDYYSCEFENGNVLVTGYDLGYEKTYYMLFDKDRNVLKDKTILGQNDTAYRPKAVALLDNGNAVVIVQYKSYTRIKVINSSGEIVDESINFSNGNFTTIKTCKLSNGNLFVFVIEEYAPSLNDYYRPGFFILSSTGTLEKGYTKIKDGGSGYDFDNGIVELDNGNIMCIRGFTDTNATQLVYDIVSPTGEIIETGPNPYYTNYDIIRYIQAQKSKNGNIIIVYTHFQGSSSNTSSGPYKLCYVIADQNGAIIQNKEILISKTIGSTTSQCTFTFKLSKNDNPIIAFGNGYLLTFYDENFSKIAEYTFTGSSVTAHFEILELENDEILLFTGSGTTMYRKRIICNADGMTSEGVEQNILNNILVDTILKENTCYELLYKENDNKFYAFERRT